MIPEVRIERLHCLEQRTDNMKVFAHTFPFGTNIDGILGIEFLTQYLFEIDPFNSKIVRWVKL